MPSSLVVTRENWFWRGATPPRNDFRVSRECICQNGRASSLEGKTRLVTSQSTIRSYLSFVKREKICQTLQQIVLVRKVSTCKSGKLFRRKLQRLELRTSPDKRSIIGRNSGLNPFKFTSGPEIFPLQRALYFEIRCTRFISFFFVFYSPFHRTLKFFLNSQRFRQSGEKEKRAMNFRGMLQRFQRLQFLKRRWI